MKTSVNQGLKKKILLTPDGYKALQEELKDLTENQRPKIVEEIQKARELGDLSENGMYSAAREKQSFIEGRVREVEEILKRAEIKKNSLSTKIVGLGSKVLLELTKQKVRYHIVGAEEVDFSQNKISHESPLGSILMGKKLGETVELEAPAGRIKYRIVDIG